MFLKEYYKGSIRFRVEGFVSETAGCALQGILFLLLVGFLSWGFRAEGAGFRV